MVTQISGAFTARVVWTCAVLRLFPDRNRPSAEHCTGRSNGTNELRNRGSSVILKQ